jgi:tubulin beta
LFLSFIQNQKLSDILLDRVRKQVEDCDNLQGFQMIHSLGGGTGSGCGSYIVEKLKHTYAHALNLSFSIVPSPSVSDVGN